MREEIPQVMDINEAPPQSPESPASSANPNPNPNPGHTMGGNHASDASPSIDSLDFVMDVPVELTVEIGRRTMKIAEVLRLATGSILELSKAAGDPLDIYVNNRPIARGEAVVIGDRYGVRITEVLVDEQRSRLGGAK
jgi:flagellar motor switch protein FliN/FliY